MKRRIKNWGNLVAISALLAISSNALSYTYYACSNGTIPKWKSPFSLTKTTVTLHLKDDAFSSSGSDQEAQYGKAMKAVAARFNENPSRIRLALKFGDSNVGSSNGQNELWWSRSISKPASAFTTYNCSTGKIEESDILFNLNKSFKPNNSFNDLVGFGGKQRGFRMAALHEVGHLAGLQHTSNTYSLMGTEYTHVHVGKTGVGAYVGEDANYGLLKLYKSRIVPTTDLSVTTFRRTGQSGGYSVHEATRMIISGTGQYATKFTDAKGVTGYEVTRGLRMRVEFGFENLGGARVSTRGNILYVISTDRVITSTDNVLARVNSSDGSVSDGVNIVDYDIKIVTIPKNLTVGKVYYLGVIVDANNQVEELKENNNTAYIPIKII